MATASASSPPPTSSTTSSPPRRGTRCSRRLAAWAAYDLLLVDELGYLTFDARGADLLYQVFNRRYQRAATIVTTNLPFKDWGKLFHNAAAASAIADRLVHRGLLVHITGKSRRSDRTVESSQQTA